MFSAIRTAFKLAGTVVDLNERLTALEANFDILDRAVKRESARVRAENSRQRKVELEATTQTEQGPTESTSVIKPLGGVMKRTLSAG
jgi:hypothetical protein